MKLSKDRLVKYVKEHPLVDRVILLLKGIRFRGDKISLYFLIKTFIQKVQRDDILDRANAVAFSFTMAVFPGVIFLFTLIPFIHNFIPSVTSDSIMEFIGTLMPPNMFDTVESTVEDIVSHSRGGLLTLGAFLSLLLSTNGTMSLMTAFNSRYQTIKKRSYLQKRLVALGLTFNMAFVLVLAILLLVGGQVVIDYLVKISFFDIDSYVIYLAYFVRLLVLFIAFLIAISSLFYFGSEVHQNWAFFSYGSVSATVLSLSVSYVFSFYISKFGTYNKLYGSIGVMLAIMVWFMLLAIILLVCYEINASVHHAVQLTKDKRNHPMLEEH
ncbi:MAG: YihY/virulence factor BrkB family protein [Cyclobacteriaceae bacterium]|nr:YihY/virulence factor BrkB family protein [Cyclobacteriaceae bacterium]